MSELPPSRAHLATEHANPRSSELDCLSTAEAFDVLNAEDVAVASAVAAARAPIVAATELVVRRLRAGGRLFYVGAGTSGRLAVLDASECPPTFHSDPRQVQAVIAGGLDALTQAVEGAEDSPTAAGAELARRGLDGGDVVFGITAGGTTPFVHGALAYARGRGAGTIFFACVPFEQVPDEADVSIRVLTGPEVVTGSTRMKAGTATKLVLNAVSTLAMVRLGKVHGNRMVDVNALANEKLVDRATRLLAELTGLEREPAHALLLRAEGSVKAAAVMHAHQVELIEAQSRLERHAGHLRAALGG